MAQQKGFACPACGAEFETREQLDSHNTTSHSHDQGTGSGSESRQSDSVSNKQKQQS